MTFAALFVSEKRERRKVSLCISRANNVRPYYPKPEFHQQTKEKSDTPSAFSFAKSGAKEKAIKKKTPMGRFRALQSATTAVGGRHRLLKKAGENFIMVRENFLWAKIFAQQAKF